MGEKVLVALGGCPRINIGLCAGKARCMVYNFGFAREPQTNLNLSVLDVVLA